MTWHETMKERIRQLEQQIADKITAKEEALYSSCEDPENESLEKAYLQLGGELEELEEQLLQAQRDEMRSD